MRVLLNGEGDPIPTQALPDELAISDLPPLAFILDGSEPFPAGDYASLGYTNFEVVCIGAAGGRGGDAFESVLFEYQWTEEQIPETLHGAYLDHLRWVYRDCINGSDQIRVDAANHEEAVTLGAFHNGDPTIFMDFATWGNTYWWSGPLNPNHIITRTLFFNPRLIGAKVWGGGGGGGGLHISGGLLSDLPALVPVVVGQVGADGASGQISDPNPLEILPGDMNDPTLILYDPANAYDTWRLRYLDRVSFSPPQPGGDGGYSAFGDVGKASGGKGGGAAIVWPGGVRTLDGHGGEGGVGDSEVAGGGAAGAISTNDGAEGTWVGNVGKGGGGGRGGALSVGAAGSSRPSIFERSAGQGGRGSYAFADTLVYGDRQPKSQYQTPTYTLHQEHPASNIWINTFPNVTYAPSGKLVIPGGGGGAKLKPPLSGRAGSKAISYSPNGLVVLRISKVE